jgi:hypothetical protein
LGDGLPGFFHNLTVQLSLYLRSLPTLLRYFFHNLGLSQLQASLAEKAVTFPIFLSFYLFLVAKLKLGNPIPVFVTLLLGYLFLLSPMLQPWYLAWVMPLVSLLPPSRLQLSVITFTASSLFYYAVLFISFYFSPLNFVWQAAMFFTMVIPPLIIWFIPSGWYTRIYRIE